MKRYLHAAAGAIMMLFLGSFYAWSLYRLELESVFPDWTEVQTSFNFTLYIIMFCLGGLLGGKLCSRLGGRISALISAAGLLAGMTGFSFIGALDSSAALWALYILYGCECGLAVGVAYIAVISGFSARFPDKPGFISGLLLTGFGLGSLILGNAVIALSGVIGFFPSMRVMAALMAAVIALGALLLGKKQDADKPEIASESIQAQTQIKSYTPSEMLKTRAFWFLALWSLLGGSLGLSVINSAASIALSFGAPAALGLIVSLFNGLGRILMGSLFDKSRKAVYLMGGLVVGSGIILTLSALFDLMPVMVLGIVGTGLGYGAIMALNATLTKLCFGPAHYGENFSIITLAGIPASFLGPTVSGFLIDKSGGGYLSTFAMMIVLGTLGAACLLGFIREMRADNRYQITDI